MEHKYAIKDYLILFLTFGLKGDYSLIRKLTLAHPWLFLPLYKLYEAKHCAFLPLTNTIEGYVDFVHKPYGCFLSMNCKIGKNCVIMHHVTIGSNNVTKGTKGGAPVIGDNVFIGAGAKIIGDIKIGNNVKIGAGCIVVTDIPDNSTVVLGKARIIPNVEN